MLGSKDVHGETPRDRLVNRMTRILDSAPAPGPIRVMGYTLALILTLLYATGGVLLSLTVLGTIRLGLHIGMAALELVDCWLAVTWFWWQLITKGKS